MIGQKGDVDMAPSKNGKHQAKNFSHLMGRVQGLSEKQLKAHFGLY